jgi:site-specific DNA-methyltransferase (adenine-specific)
VLHVLATMDGVANQVIEQWRRSKTPTLMDARQTVSLFTKWHHNAYMSPMKPDLHRGDCFNVLPNIRSGSVDLIFADPPYLLSNGGTTCKSGKRVSVDKGKWDKSLGREEDYQFHKYWLEACRRVLAPTGSLFVSGTHHNIFTVGYALQVTGWNILNAITWYKPNAPPNLGCRTLTHSAEFLIWAAPTKTKPMPHLFNYKLAKKKNGGKQLRDVW